MALTPSIMFGKVMHKRLFPKINAFNYRIYYLALPLAQMTALPLPRNRFGTLSFYDKDHGKRDGSDLSQWVRGILIDYDIDQADGEITLICLPRIIGYVFNPVSFFLCADKAGQLRAVLCEVHNTFGEQHSYLCAHQDQRIIASNDILQGQKVFHVSPFLKREGDYHFRFDVTDQNFGVWIDFYDGEGKKQLVTALTGRFEAMNKHSLHKALWHYPLITFKTILLIHWQAIKLLSKGIKYIAKPAQIMDRVSGTNNLTKK